MASLNNTMAFNSKLKQVEEMSRSLIKIDTSFTVDSFSLFLEEVTEAYVRPDIFHVNQVILTAEFLNLWKALMRVYIKRSKELPNETHIAFITLTKCLTVKSNFKYLANTLIIILNDFQSQIHGGVPQPYTGQFLTLLSSLVSNPIILPTDRYFFVSTMIGEYLSVDMSKIRMMRETLKGFTVFMICQTDLDDMEGENYFISKLQLTDSINLKLRINNGALQLLVFKRERIIGEFIVFEKLAVIFKRNYNFISLSIQVSPTAWPVMVSVNGSFYLQTLVFEKPEELIGAKMKIEAFENMAVVFNGFGMIRMFLDRGATERLRSVIGTIGVSSLDSLRRFQEEFASWDIMLIHGLSRVKIKAGTYRFQEHKIDKGVSFHGFINVIQMRQFAIDNLLIRVDLVGKLITSLAFFHEKDAIVRLVLSQCKNIPLLRLASIFNARDYLAELKSALCCIGFKSHMSAFVARVIPNLVENDNNPFLKDIINNFVLSYEMLSEVPSGEPLAEYFQHLFICFQRVERLPSLVNFDKFQRTLLSFFQASYEDELALLKLAKLAGLGEYIIAHLESIDSLDISPLVSLFGCQKLPQTENHRTFYKLVLKLIKSNKTAAKNKEYTNSGLTAMLKQVTDLKLVSKLFRLLLTLNGNDPQPLLLAWRIKFIPGHTVTNVLETHFAYSVSDKKLRDCEPLLEKLKMVIFERSIRESATNEFGRWADAKFTSLAFEASLAFDIEALKIMLLNLNLSIKQYSKEFMANVAPSQLYLWLFTVLQQVYPERKAEPSYELALKLLALYVSECLSRKNSIRSFRNMFYIAAWYIDSKDRRAAISEALSHVFKSLTQRNLKFDKESDFSSFLAVLFMFFNYTFHQKAITPETASAWIWLFGYIERNVVGLAKRSLLVELDRQISKTMTMPSIRILFFKQGFEMNNSSYKTTVLYMMKLMVFEVSRALLSLGTDEHTRSVSSLLTSLFSVFYELTEKDRTELIEELLLDYERFLVELLQFVSAFPPLHGCFPDIVKVIRMTKAQEHGFLAKFWGASQAASSDDSELLKWLEGLSVDENFSFQTTAELESKHRLEVQQCQSEVENALLQADMLAPKFDEGLETYIAKNVVRVAEIQAIQRLQFSTFIDSLEVESAIEKAGLRHSYRKQIKNAHDQNKFLYPKELNLKVYRGNTNQIGEFDSERLEGVRYKHRNLINRDLQKPFLKIRSKHFLTLPFTQYDLPSTEKYLNYIQQHKLSTFTVTWVKKFSLITGYLFMDSGDETFSFLVNQSLHKQRKNPIELVEYKPRTDKKLLFQWRCSHVYEIHAYKFLQKRNALEVFFVDSRSEIFDFETKYLADQFARVLLRAAPSKTPRAFDPSQLFKKNDYLENWKNERISNFKYLMLVNSHASRSLGDIAQYPVFPVVIDRIDNEGCSLRDLEQPIGVVGDKKRKESFILRLQQYSSFNKGPGYNFGSHYSSPAIVLSFLIRLRPYEQGCRAIQNGSFDLPDRLFFSVKSTLRNIMNDISDVREFIPELFYLPAIYLNLNHFDFGRNQSNVRVHDVLIPELFGSNVYRFIYGMRKILESEAVSSNLGKWIDLIFGVMQTGEKARKVNNVFYPLTYEGCLDRDSPTDPDALEATENQIYHFGQTPIQLFQSSHPNKTDFARVKNLVNSRSSCVFKQISNVDAGVKGERPYFVKKMKSEDFDNGKLIFYVKKNHILLFRHIDKFIFNSENQRSKVVFEEVISLSKIKSVYFNPGTVDSRADGIVEILPEYKILFGGFLSGKICLFAMKEQKLLGEFAFHPATVLKLLCIRSDWLLSVDETGLIACSAINASKNIIVPYYVIFDFFGFEVRSLSLCSADNDFFCYFTTKGSFEIRCIRSPSKVLFSLPYQIAFKDREPPVQQSKFDHCLISFGYVNCLVVSSYSGGRCDIVTFSFEGNIISRYTMKDRGGKFTHMMIVKDEFFSDSLLAVNEKGDNYMFDLPLLDRGHKISGLDDFQMRLLMTLSPNQSFLAVNKEGSMRIFSV